MNIAFIASIINALNQTVDIISAGLFTCLIIVINYRYFVASVQDEMKKEAKRRSQRRNDKVIDGDEISNSFERLMQNPGVQITGTLRAVYLWILLIVAQTFFLLIFFLIPNTPWISAENLRWIEACLVLSSLVFFLTHQNGDGRGLYSVWGHLAVLWFGWNLGRWLGILFVSLPLVAIYYHLVYRFAEVIIPASDPDDQKEKFERFKVLFWYMWGMQFPIIVVTDPTGMHVETRIQGDMFQDYTGRPGYIWTHPHQVVGLSSGTNFSRVEGPGAIFTRPAERPLGVIDLRTQLRTSEVEAITQDGIPIKAIVFMSFAVAREPWERGLYNRMRYVNPVLDKGMLPDHGHDHFQYSRARVRAVLSMEGVRTNILGPVGSCCLRWDEQVVHLIEEAARRIISEIPLSEMWQPNPIRDAKGVSALDLLADRIKDESNPDGLYSVLQENGIHLYTARVVNYLSLNDKPEDKVDEITRQQIPAWRARWKRQVEHKLVEADAEAEQKQLDANALARSMLLTSVAQSLQNTSENNKDLPRYLIAMRFLGALDEMIRQEPKFATADKGKALRDRIAFLEGNPPPSKG